VSRYGTCLANENSRKLVEQLRFPSHSAPGEAEAECAQLQKLGIVDMVMSDDGDAVMFGSKLTLRNWSKEGARGNKEPTHVDLLDLRQIKDGPKLDPEGMILVALLSGGDYNQQGLPGFGVHVACDIARAGFGSDLIQAVQSNDEDALQDWRERLEYELNTNESGYFKKRHRTLKIPKSFPDRTILRYYTSPVVSSPDALKQLEMKWSTDWQASIDVQSLRSYTAETFDWRYKPGALKLVRSLARPLLADRLQNGFADQLIRSSGQIHERREHYTMGGIPELRVSATPVDVVGLDLDTEEDSPEYLAMLDAEGDVDEQAPDDDDVTTAVQSPSKTKKPAWSPYQSERTWLPETLVELGVPALLEEWNQAQRDKAELKAKPLKKSRAAKLPKEVNRIDQYFGATRPNEPPVANPSRVPEAFRQTVAATKASASIAAKQPPRNPLRRAISEISPDLKQYFKPAKVIPGVGQIALNKSKHHLSSPSPSPTRELPTALPGNSAIVIGTLADPISIESSPAAHAEAGSSSAVPKTPTRKPAMINSAQLSPPMRELEQSVTQRSSRRVRKKLERAKTEGDVPSDDSGFPLDEISLPNSVEFSVKKLDYVRATKTMLPPELSTGLKTDFGRKKVLAAPRGSLAGTWKEIDVDLVEDIAMTESRKPSRVSCVDLAAD
jgi:holliday junction resolvase YEN1